MGQIFYACAYDTESMTCSIYNADKFHANCYAFSGAVLAMHYLLRQKSYRIMWGGDYVVLDDYLSHVSRNEDLLGISTYEDYTSFDDNNPDLTELPYYDKVKLIDEKHKLWNNIDVWYAAMDYFDWDKTNSVTYNGYLINHTKNLAINLQDYYKQSVSLIQNGVCSAIDLVPVLTETGGGTQMVLFDGLSTDTTEVLAGTWMGDLLQIVDQIPENYELINCCFADLRGRVLYCERKFGVDEKGFVLKDDSGNRFEAAMLNILGKRGPSSFFKVVDNSTFAPVSVTDA